MTSETLYNINLSSKVNATNVFVLLQPKSTTFTSDNFHYKESFQLPVNCKKIILNLINSSNNDNMENNKNCCNDLIVYNEFENIKISNELSSNDIEKNCKEMANDDRWYESNIFIRGYKDVLVKGKNIWTV